VELLTCIYTGSYLGDVNLDSGVDIADASILGVSTINAEFVMTNEQRLHGDVNGDGLITVADVLSLHEYLATKVTS
jgi:hypothetical protein